MSTPGPAQRDVMEYDVAVVGGGPAGLATAIRLKQRKPELTICVLEKEHEHHGHTLAALRAIANDYAPPPHACATWRALYDGLANLEAQLMQHIHLENNALFPRAIRG